MDRRLFLKMPMGIGASLLVAGELSAHEKSGCTVRQIFFPDAYSENLFNAKFQTGLGSSFNVSNNNVHIKSRVGKCDIYIETVNGNGRLHLHDISNVAINCPDNFHLLVKAGDKVYYQKFIMNQHEAPHPSNLNYIANRLESVGVPVTQLSGSNYKAVVIEVA